MKTRLSKCKRTMAIALVALSTVGAIQSYAAGLLKPVGQSDEGVYIKSHVVNVTINNGFARTEVDQVFGNSTDNDMEAIYSFPLPKQASLSEVSLWIDGQEVIGEVVQKQRARKIYEEQVAKGNDVALAEQDDFKSFDVNVGLVRAHSDTRVRLVYYQPLEIDLNIGRYLYPVAEGGVDEERIAFWSVDDQVNGPFLFNLEIKSAFPIKDVRVPNHNQQAVITNDEEYENSVYHVTINKEEGTALSEDIVVYYRLDETAPARVELVPYRESQKDQGTFMVVVTPAADLQRIEEGTDWIFVLDTSGSMSGQKINTLAEGVARVLGKMSPNDRFQIISFNNSANNLTHGYVTATPGHVNKWINEVKAIRSGGGTALYAGLKESYRTLDEDRTTGIILVTDGVCNVGPTKQSHFLDLLKQHDIRLFTFVIGNSANQPLLERIATDSGGFAMNISDADDIVGRLIQAKAKVLHQCMHDVELIFHGEKVKDITPQKIGNLFMGQQLVMFGHYNGSGEVDIELKARISGEAKSWHCRANLPEQDRANPEIERLWALSAIEDTMKVIRESGETKRLQKQVADLGVEYSLVTDYTSMLVVKDDVFEGEGIQRRNAERVDRERKAQEQRATQPVQNHRIDQGQHTFQGRRSPGIGTGPVGPLFVIIAAWAARKKQKQEQLPPQL